MCETEECFPCYFGGKAGNDNVEKHPICFGCMYKISNKTDSFYKAIASINKKTNEVAFHYCVLCKKDKLCITNIIVCSICSSHNDGIKDSGDEDSCDEDSCDEDEDKEFTEDDENAFYNSIETLCFRCIDQIQCVKYKLYPRNRDILLWYIQRHFVNTYKFECGKCHTSRWSCTTISD